MGAVARNAVPLLEKLYSTSAMLEALATRYGDEPSRWPPTVLRQLRYRHNALVTEARLRVCALPDYTYIIGELTTVLGFWGGVKMCLG